MAAMNSSFPQIVTAIFASRHPLEFHIDDPLRKKLVMLIGLKCSWVESEWANVE